MPETLGIWTVLGLLLWAGLKVLAAYHHWNK